MRIETEHFLIDSRSDQSIACCMQINDFKFISLSKESLRRNSFIVVVTHCRNHCNRDYI